MEVEGVQGVRALINKFDTKESDARKTGEEMDEIRRRTLAYEYLCHLEETKVWLEACLRETLPASTDLEEGLRNGVYLAKLARFMCPDDSRIYDADQKRYKVAGLQFRHTDNIHKWLQALKTIKLPSTFHPETTDVYDKKNMPRVIYCLHALSAHLFKLGRAPVIVDLYGKVTFTDEEIDVMSKELQKYGIAMPSFQKIGGLLSKDLGDSGALHAAIININRALDTNSLNEPSLSNPAAKLQYVLKELLPVYYGMLQYAKQTKVQNFLNRSSDKSYTADVYDELLTHSEIQGYITIANTNYTVGRVFEALQDDDEDTLFTQLSQPWMQLKNLKHDNRFAYFKAFMAYRDAHGEHNMCSVDSNIIFQSIITDANANSDIKSNINNVVSALNQALDQNNYKSFKISIQKLNEHMQIDMEDFFMMLFYEELQMAKIDKDELLSYDDIRSNIHVLSMVGYISKIIELNDSNMLWNILSNNMLELKNLRKEANENYFSAMKIARKAKQQAALPCTLLTLMDIQDCIDSVNVQDVKTQELFYHLQSIDEAVKNNNKDELMMALQYEKFSSIIPLRIEESVLYMDLLKACKKKKNNSELWLDDVQNIMKVVNNELLQIESVRRALVSINSALLRIDSKELIAALKSLDCVNFAQQSFDEKKFLHVFHDAFQKRIKNRCPWVVFHTNSGKTAYINIETDAHSWSTPKNFSPDSRYISIKDVVNLMNEYQHQNADMKEKQKLSLIVTLQAHIKGFLVRRKYSQLLYYQRNISSIVKIQAWWKSHLVQKKYRVVLLKKLEEKKQANDPRKKFLHYKERERKIIRIQALWRGRKTRQAFLSLFQIDNPPFRVVKHFSTLLDFSIDDYEKEIQLQNLKAEVVQTIRKNQELSKQLDDMDIKIGLLIQNRITLQDVLMHRKKVNEMVKNSNSAINLDAMKPNDTNTVNAKSYVTSSIRGWKTLTKESRMIMETYQRLFYMLQTNPIYLSKLLFCLPQSKTNQFLQNVILTLYNFGSNARDEYLLLKLFRCSLEEEISCKFDRPMDLITGSPIVLRIAVNHARQMNGLTCLRNIVGPLVDQVLNDKNLCLETSPVNIYKTWRNQIETRTGKPSDLPYIVTQEQALSHQEVKFRLKRALETLKMTVEIFLDRIISCCDMLPFSITYIARVLNYKLTKKFPEAPEKDILKVIGHLVYYQFINAAIIAPDAFDIVTLPHDIALSTDQRKNLASVAKILQFASSKKGFGDESEHLQCLNPFIIECHEKFKSFFRKCCQGPTLEEYFCMDEYSEATLLYKPQIFISVQEICDTHSLLVEYEDTIAADPADKLHEILDLLGPLDQDGTMPIVAMTPSLNTEVCLTLVDKSQVVPDATVDINKLFIKTKELCVSVLPFLNGEHLLEALCIGTTKEQQDRYKAHVQQRLYSGMVRQEECKSLREHIALLRKYLNYLEDEGYVTREDGYQSIMTSIAVDLKNKGKFRASQIRALQTLRNTKSILDKKAQFYQDQCEYYNQYINTCLANLNAGKRGMHKAGKSLKKVKTKSSIKWNATKLYDKGVLVDIDGLTPNQYKNVLFEITPTDHNGIFEVKGKFMGVEVDKVEIDIQNLLQLQYDGCTIMDLFGKAKVNVNLLLFLLNSKFYGKPK